MGMTVVEKILARASGRDAVARRATWSSRASTWPCRTRTRRWSSTSSTRSSKGTGLEPTDLGPVEDRDHLRPPGAGRVAEDRDQPEEDPRVRRRARASPSSTTSAATRAASATRSCPRTATCGRATVVVGHRLATRPATARSAPSPSASAPPRWRRVWALGVARQRRGAGHDQGRRERRASRRTCGPKDLILHLDRPAHRRGRQLPGARVPRRDHPSDVRPPAASSSAT